MRMFLAILVALMVAACGGEASGPEFESMSEFREAVEQNTDVSCADFEEGGELYTRESGTCYQGDGEAIGLAVFDGNENRDKWLEFAKDFGGIYVVGDGWTISVNSQERAEQLAEAMGGEVR